MTGRAHEILEVSREAELPLVRSMALDALAHGKRVSVLARHRGERHFLFTVLPTVDSYAVVAADASNTKHAVSAPHAITAGMRQAARLFNGCWE